MRTTKKKRGKCLFLTTASVVVIFALAHYGCRKPPPRPNILLISIDTCRADHLGCYGKRGAGTRHLDAFASQAVLFENVISPLPLTLPAHSSLLTGALPPVHGVRDNFNYRLSDAAVTLAERLRDSGYATVAAVGTVVLDKQFGLSQGFDVYDDRMDPDRKDLAGNNERRGEEVSAFATRWLAQRDDKPFFMFLHYYDPHHEYLPPLPFAATYAADPYAGEIAYVDNCIGAVLEDLKRRDLFDTALIVVTADHGEGRDDHHERFHGFFIYHSTTKVPLLIKRPGQREAGRVRKAVGLIDVAPTILAQVGAPALDDAQGVDLTPLMEGRAGDAPPRFHYVESLVPTKYGCTSLRSIESDDWKYIQALRPELYHVAQDPGESTNRFEQQADRARTMRNRLKDMVQRLQDAALDADSLAPNAAMVAKMLDLGYVGGAVLEEFHLDDYYPQGAEDPKDFFPVLSTIETIQRHMSRKEYDLARAAAAKVNAKGYGAAYILTQLGQIASFENKLEEAIEHYTEALALRPTAIDWRTDLGIFYAQSGRDEEAVGQYRRAIDTIVSESAARPGVSAREAAGHPLYVKLHVILGDSLKRLGRYDEAVAVLGEVLRVDPDHTEARKALRELGNVP